MDLQLWLRTGYVDDDSGCVATEFPHHVISIITQSLPLIQIPGKSGEFIKLGDYLTSHSVECDIVYLIFSNIPPKLISSIVSDLISFYDDNNDNAADTWMEGNITLPNNQELSLVLVGISITPI